MCSWRNPRFAPYEAIVVRREVDEGRVVDPDEPLLRLQELGPPRARIGVAGRHAEQFVVGVEQTLLPDRQSVWRDALAALGSST